MEEVDEVRGRPERIGDRALAADGGDDRAVLLGEQHGPGEGRLGVEPGELLEGAGVGAAGGSDDDG